MRKIAVLMMFFAVFAVSGCAGVMNPYNSNFQCPETEKGKCVSVQTAYGETLKENTKGKDCKDCDTNRKEENALRRELEDIKPKSSASDYQTALYRKLAGLLKEPVTPVVAPPQVMRVLFLSYTGENEELYMPRYVFFFVDKPKWILDNHLDEVE